jgi:hypothetical protein
MDTNCTFTWVLGEGETTEGCWATFDINELLDLNWQCPGGDDDNDGSDDDDQSDDEDGDCYADCEGEAYNWMISC